MLFHLFYEDKGTFLQNLHTAAGLGYAATLCVLALLFSHPLYLVGIFIVGVVAIVTAGVADKWQLYLRFGFWMAVMILIVNTLVDALVAHAGASVIWPGISLEAICYGGAMGVRMLAVLTAICFGAAIVHPERALQLFSRCGYRTALVFSLAARMLPTLNRDLARIRDAQRMRGVDFGVGTAGDRLRQYAWLLETLLLSSLEGAFQTAEAMQARAFGSGPRSCYRQEAVRPRDILCLVTCALALGVAGYVQVKGYGTYTYYPRLDVLVRDARFLLLLNIVLGLLLFPVLLHWGWQYCPYLKRKI